MKTFYSTYQQKKHDPKDVNYSSSFSYSSDADDVFDSMLHPNESYSDKLSRKFADKVGDKLAAEMDYNSEVAEINNRLEKIESLVLSLDTESNEDELRQKMVSVVNSKLHLHNVIPFTEHLQMCKQRTIQVWFEEMKNFHLKFFKTHKLTKEEIKVYVKDFIIPLSMRFNYVPERKFRNLWMFYSAISAAQEQSSDNKYIDNFFDWAEEKLARIESTFSIQYEENEKAIRTNDIVFGILIAFAVGCIAYLFGGTLPAFLIGAVLFGIFYLLAGKINFREKVFKTEFAFKKDVYLVAPEDVSYRNLACYVKFKDLRQEAKAHSLKSWSQLEPSSIDDMLLQPEKNY
jgi:hypothetical protein